MAFPDYTAADTSDGTLSTVLLGKQIEAEPLITTELLAVTQKGSNFVLVFISTPPAIEQIECDTKVAAHKNLEAVRDRLVSEIKTHRDEKRLVEDIFFEYPAASGNLFGCSAASQDNWGKLATLDAQGAVTYPYTVTTHDERGSYNLIDTADRQTATATIAVVVEGERALAAGYIADVLAALDEATAQAIANTYLAL
ncbi:MAG: hypothetical protein HRT46_12325 [Deltaproteobacteria bacterium]|nr:hypothetical protein [Deltaproteobacteria bacterium]